jgi:biofilm PGA synthesis lipoprotein PgaB
MIRQATLWLFVLLAALTETARAGSLVVLNYHDVVPDPANDRFAVSRSMFVAHMDFLQQNGYVPLSLAYVEQVVANKAPLPDKAVLLTFDDGLKSYREFVAPLLAIYEYPSVISLVSSWMDGVDVPPEYTGKLMSWNDARELSRNRFVTIANHTHNLHRGVVSNPQNNERGAATTRQYFPDRNAYENEAQFRERVRNDLKVSLARFKHELGVEPRAIEWPYCEYDHAIYEEAVALGMPVQFVLADGVLDRLEIGVLGRMLMVDQPSPAQFARLLEAQTPAPRRFVEIRLDDFVGENAEQHEQRLSALLDRLQPLNPNAIVIWPATRDGKKVFFSTPSAELATDILDRVIHQIRVRLNVRQFVLRIPTSIAVTDRTEFFTDLARLNRFEGLAFEPGAPKELVTQARRVVPTYRTRVKFGVFGDIAPGANYDFHILSEAQWRESRGFDASRDWVLFSSPDAMSGAVRAAGAAPSREYVNYGFPFDSISKSSESRDVVNRVVSKGG